MDTTHQHPEGTLFVLTHPEDVQGDQWRSPHLSTFSVKDMQEPFHEELRNRYPRIGAKGVEGSPTANVGPTFAGALSLMSSSGAYSGSWIVLGTLFNVKFWEQNS